MIRAGRKTVVLAAATIVALLGVSPTATADPYWQPVTLTGDFHCSANVPHSYFHAYMRTCVVVNGTATQAVAVVVNHGSSTIAIKAPAVQLWVNGALSYDRDCLSSALSPYTTTACFGPTQQRPCGTTVHADVTVTLGLTDLRASSPSRQMCT